MLLKYRIICSLEIVITSVPHVTCIGLAITQYGTALLQNHQVELKHGQETIFGCSKLNDHVNASRCLLLVDAVEQEFLKWLAMDVAAIGRSIDKQVHEWDTTILDDILFNGDDLYADIVFRMNEDNRASPRSGALEITDLSIADSISLSYFRPTWMEIDLDGIRTNVQVLKKYIGDKVHLMAVIKSNAYGFGAVEIAKTSISAGATWLGVATLDEALFVRSKLAQDIPILVLGYVSPKHLSIASRNSITVTAVSLQWIQEAARIAKKSFDFHLKLDTGLNRIGCKTIEEVRAVANIVSKHPYMNWTGAFTHFATSDDVINKYYYLLQLALFHKFLLVIPELNNKIVHCANSGIVLYQLEKPFFNMVRIGRALTGPIVEKLKSLQLVPLEPIRASLHSTLILVKQLNIGEKVGYDGTYMTTQKQWIGTIPMGYGDGWHKHLGSSTVLVDGKRVQIVGRIAMDQMMVALPHSFPVGTRVTFIGQQFNETISIQEIEKNSNQPRHEIFPSFSSRIPRIYTQNDLVVSIVNPLLDLVIV